MDSTPVTFVLMRREKTETHRQRRPCNCGRQRLGECGCKPRNAKDASTTSWQGRILPETLRVCALANSLIQAFWTLQRQERIHFCCFNPPSIWSFVTAALGNYCKKEILLVLPQGACSIAQQTPRSQGHKLQKACR